MQGETNEQAIARIKAQTAALEAAPKEQRRKLAWAFRVLSPVNQQLKPKK